MTKDLITERLRLRDVYPDRAKEVAKEYNLKADEIELVRKGVVSEKVETDKEEKSVVSYINTATKDRDNEVIDPQGAILKNYRKNPVVPYGHDYRGLPVGKNIWVKKDKNGLIAKTVFLKHPFANDVGYCYTEDVAGTGPAMKAWSIGFIPLKWEENPDGKEHEAKEGEKDSRVRRKYNKWELVEYSAVMVPSNPDALTVMVEKGLITSDKLKKDIAELIEIEDRPDSPPSEPEPFEDLLQEVCPECGKDVAEDDKEGFHFCLSCEWNNADGKTDPDLVLKRVITKPEETDDFIRLPAKGEQGKHKGHKIRWITVSAKQGIRGIYCIDCKKIITFVFDKKKGWTMEKAKKWMEDHGKDIKVEARKAYGKELVFVTEGNKTLDFIPPDEEVIELEDDKDGSTITDETQSDKETKESKQTVGEVTIKIKGDASELEAELEKLKAKYEEIADINWGKFAEEIQPQLIDMIEELKDEVKSFKEGRVLSEKNRKLVKQCADMLLQLHEATEPPKREEIEIEVEKDKNTKNGVNDTDKLDIDTDKLTEIIQGVFKNNIDKISEMVQTKLDKMRGKVS